MDKPRIMDGTIPTGPSRGLLGVACSIPALAGEKIQFSRPSEKIELPKPSLKEERLPPSLGSRNPESSGGALTFRLLLRPFAPARLCKRNWENTSIAATIGFFMVRTACRSLRARIHPGQNSASTKQIINPKRRWTVFWKKETNAKAVPPTTNRQIQQTNRMIPAGI